MITLFLDTTSNKEVIVRLTIDNGIFEEKIEILASSSSRSGQNNRTQVVLPTIQKLLKEHNLTVQDIQKVEVNPGPGSFTGVRVGAAIANSIIFGLGLSQDLIEPIYT